MLNIWMTRGEVRRAYPIGCRVEVRPNEMGGLDHLLAGQQGMVYDYDIWYGQVHIAVSIAHDDGLAGDVYWFQPNEIKHALPPLHYEWDFDRAG